jgi:hypothetical protein
MLEPLLVGNIGGSTIEGMLEFQLVSIKEGGRLEGYWSSSWWVYRNEGA